MVSGSVGSAVFSGTGTATVQPAVSETAPSVKSTLGKKSADVSPVKHSSADTAHSGSRGSGAGGGALVMVDGPVGASGYYLEIIRRRVESNWKPPVVTGSIVAGVKFDIRSNGKIESVTIEKPSGRMLFDQAAQRAVLNAGRLPPLPGDFGDKLTVHIDFEPVWIN
jgi:TonB family protein